MNIGVTIQIIFAYSTETNNASISENLTNKNF